MQGFLKDDDGKRRYYVVHNTFMVAFKNPADMALGDESARYRHDLSRLLSISLTGDAGAKSGGRGGSFSLRFAASGAQARDSQPDSDETVTFLAGRRTECNRWVEYLSPFTRDAKTSAAGIYTIPRLLERAINICTDSLRASAEQIATENARAGEGLAPRGLLAPVEPEKISTLVAELVSGEASLDASVPHAAVAQTLAELLRILPETLLTNKHFPAFFRCINVRALESPLLQSRIQEVTRYRLTDEQHAAMRMGQHSQNGGKTDKKQKSSRRNDPAAKRHARARALRGSMTSGAAVRVPALRLTKKRRLKPITLSIHRGVLTWKPCSKKVRSFTLSNSVLINPVPDWPSDKRSFKHHLTSFRVVENGVAIDIALKSTDTFMLVAPLLRQQCSITRTALQQSQAVRHLSTVDSAASGMPRNLLGEMAESLGGSETKRPENVPVKIAGDAKHSDMDDAGGGVGPVLDLNALIQAAFIKLDINDSGLVGIDGIRAAHDNIDLGAEEPADPATTLQQWAQGGGLSLAEAQNTEGIPFDIFRSFIEQSSHGANAAAFLKFCQSHGLSLTNDSGSNHENGMEDGGLLGGSFRDSDLSLQSLRSGSPDAEIDGVLRALGAGGGADGVEASAQENATKKKWNVQLDNLTPAIEDSSSQQMDTSKTQKSVGWAQTESVSVHAEPQLPRQVDVKTLRETLAQLPAQYATVVRSIAVVLHTANKANPDDRVVQEFADLVAPTLRRNGYNCLEDSALDLYPLVFAWGTRYNAIFSEHVQHPEPKRTFKSILKRRGSGAKALTGNLAQTPLSFAPSPPPPAVPPKVPLGKATGQPKPKKTASLKSASGAVSARGKQNSLLFSFSSARRTLGSRASRSGRGGVGPRPNPTPRHVGATATPKPSNPKPIPQQPTRQPAEKSVDASDAKRVPVSERPPAVKRVPSIDPGLSVNTGDAVPTKTIHAVPSSASRASRASTDSSARIDRPISSLETKDPIDVNSSKGAEKLKLAAKTLSDDGSPPQLSMRNGPQAQQTQSPSGQRPLSPLSSDTNDDSSMGEGLTPRVRPSTGALESLAEINKSPLAIAVHSSNAKAQKRKPVAVSRGEGAPDGEDAGPRSDDGAGSDQKRAKVSGESKGSSARRRVDRTLTKPSTPAKHQNSAMAVRPEEPAPTHGIVTLTIQFMGLRLLAFAGAAGVSAARDTLQREVAMALSRAAQTPSEWIQMSLWGGDAGASSLCLRAQIRFETAEKAVFFAKNAPLFVKLTRPAMLHGLVEDAVFAGEARGPAPPVRPHSTPRRIESRPDPTPRQNGRRPVISWMDAQLAAEREAAIKGSAETRAEDVAIAAPFKYYPQNSLLRQMVEETKQRRAMSDTSPMTPTRRERQKRPVASAVPLGSAPEPAKALSVRAAAPRPGLTPKRIAAGGMEWRGADDRVLDAIVATNDAADARFGFFSRKTVSAAYRSYRGANAYKHVEL